MTRINCVPVEELHQKHLVAEYRELPRTFGLVRKFVDRNDTLAGQSATYTLGTGHVKFFYDKLTFLANRQRALVAEMIRRGYNPTHRTDLEKEFSSIPLKFWNDWIPTEAAIKINRDRIRDRMPK